MKKIINKRIGILFFLIGFIILLFYLYILTQISYSSIFDIFSILLVIFYFTFILTGSFFLRSSGLNEIEKQKMKKITFFCFFLLYLMILCKMLFKYGTGWEYNSLRNYYVENSNFIPLKNISMYLISFLNNSMNKYIIIENVLGNILMFLPMGFFLAVLFPKIKRKSFFYFLGFIAFFEIFQLLTKMGFFDIDDILLNLIGFTVGTYFTQLRLFKKTNYEQNKKEKVEKHEAD